MRLVGVGLGYDSMDSFMEGNYWGDNEIYVDPEKKLYRALGLGKATITDLANAQVRAAKAKATAKGIEGNMSGTVFLACFACFV